MATETSVTEGSQSWADAHPLPFGSSLPEFKLLEPATGRWWTSNELDRNAVFAVLFVCNHCPHSRAWEPRLVELARELADRVNWVFISPSNPEGFPEDGPDAIAEHARTERFPVPYLIDPDQAVADAFSAVRTPHAFVFDRKLGLEYRGTVDDNEEDPSAVTQPYLRDALEAVLAGRPVTVPETALQGCGIKRTSDLRAMGVLR